MRQNCNHLEKKKTMPPNSEDPEAALEEIANGYPNNCGDKEPTLTHLLVAAEGMALETLQEPLRKLVSPPNVPKDEGS